MDLNPSSRCHIFQRFVSCLTPFVDGVELLEEPATSSSSLDQALLSSIEMLFEGRPRAIRKIDISAEEKEVRLCFVMTFHQYNSATGVGEVRFIE